MKFTVSTIIQKPRDVVAQYFIDPVYLDKYQEGFIRKELQSGTAQQTGAVSLMYYDMGKRGEMELKETIVKNNLPEEFLAEYHHEHMDNTMHVVFTAIDESTTKYESTIDYTVFRGFMIKIIAFLFGKKMFKKPAQKWLDNFKKFVEEQN